ncbi:hypothetical protein MBLNU459_g6086t1 [Dothideomycetes sp. NU459]
MDSNATASDNQVDDELQPHTISDEEWKIVMPIIRRMRKSRRDEQSRISKLNSAQHAFKTDEPSMEEPSMEEPSMEEPFKVHTATRPKPTTTHFEPLTPHDWPLTPHPMPLSSNPGPLASRQPTASHPEPHIKLQTPFHRRSPAVTTLTLNTMSSSSQTALNSTQTALSYNETALNSTQTALSYNETALSSTPTALAQRVVEPPSRADTRSTATGISSASTAISSNPSASTQEFGQFQSNANNNNNNNNTNTNIGSFLTNRFKRLLKKPIRDTSAPKKKALQISRPINFQHLPYSLPPSMEQLRHDHVSHTAHTYHQTPPPIADVIREQQQQQQAEQQAEHQSEHEHEHEHQNEHGGPTAQKSETRAFEKQPKRGMGLVRNRLDQIRASKSLRNLRSAPSSSELR